MTLSPHVEYRRVTDEDLLRMTIMNKTVLSDRGCWEWQGAHTRGYGTLMRGRERLRVHRLSYELWCGPIPDGMVMRHQCDNPRCVNPGHLTPGTQGDNVRDQVERGRHGRTKLSAALIAEIREGAGSNRDFAEKFGVGIIAIRRARAGETWKHVPSSPTVGA